MLGAGDRSVAWVRKTLRGWLFRRFRFCSMGRGLPCQRAIRWDLRVCVRTRKSSPQGLKPDVFSILYGPVGFTFWRHLVTQPF